MPSQRHAHRPEQRVEPIVQFEQIGQQHEQLVIVASSHRRRQGGSQDVDLVGGGKAVTALLVIRGQRKRHAMVGQEALQGQRHGVVVLEQRRQPPWQQTLFDRQEGGQPLAPARVPPGVPGEQGDAQKSQHSHRRQHETREEQDVHEFVEQLRQIRHDAQNEEQERQVAQEQAGQEAFVAVHPGAEPDTVRQSPAAPPPVARESTEPVQQERPGVHRRAQPLRVHQPGEGVGERQQPVRVNPSLARIEGGGVGQQVQQSHQVCAGPVRTQAGADAMLVEQEHPGQVAGSGAGLGHARGDLHQTLHRPPSGRGHADCIRRVDEQGAAHRHLGLVLLGNEPIPTGGHLPGDGPRRVAGLIVAQVEQFAPRTGRPLTVNAGRRQAVVPFHARCLVVRVDQARQHAQHLRVAQEFFLVEEPTGVGQLQAQPLEARQTGRFAGDLVDELQWRLFVQWPRRLHRALNPVDVEGHPSGDHGIGQTDSALEDQRLAHLEGLAIPEGLDRSARVADLATDAQTVADGEATHSEIQPAPAEPDE